MLWFTKLVSLSANIEFKKFKDFGTKVSKFIIMKDNFIQ